MNDPSHDYHSDAELPDTERRRVEHEREVRELELAADASGERWWGTSGRQTHADAFGGLRGGE